MFAAIDVGTNAVRLELARPLPEGALETVHQERDPIRPGEGVFATGAMPVETANRLVSTLGRYAAHCRKHHATVRAVATSALREAGNRDAVVRRVLQETGLRLEVVSGREEARLICLGVLHGRPARARSLLVDIGGGSTEVALARGEDPTELWSLGLGAVRLTELFGTSGAVAPRRLRLLRSYVADALRKGLPARLPRAPRKALGSSGTINAVLGFAAQEGRGHATREELTRAVDALAELGPLQRRRRFDPKRADVIVAGAVVLEGVAHHLELESVTAVGRGLRHGVLVDLLRRQHGAPAGDHQLADAALALAQRFDVDVTHARQVARLALSLFDQLPALHQLPPSVRPYLEAAALLHDVGKAVSHDRHHRHTYYLVHHADIPGLADSERELVARIARYHRRSFPDPGHAGMEGLGASDARTVRRLATLLRIADRLDRSNSQAVRALRARVGRAEVGLALQTGRRPVDLELWNLEGEAENFRRVFGRRLAFHVAR